MYDNNIVHTMLEGKRKSLQLMLSLYEVRIHMNKRSVELLYFIFTVPFVPTCTTTKGLFHLILVCNAPC